LDHKLTIILTLTISFPTLIA